MTLPKQKYETKTELRELLSNLLKTALKYPHGILYLITGDSQLHPALINHLQISLKI